MKAGGGLTCMCDAVADTTFMSVLSGGHPTWSVGSRCLCSASSLAGGLVLLVAAPLPPSLPLASVSIWNIYGMRGMHDSREQGGFMASRQCLVQMCRAAAISCQQNLWRYTSQEKVVSNLFSEG